MLESALVLIRAVVAAFHQGSAGVSLGEEADLLLPPEAVGGEEFGHLVLRRTVVASGAEEEVFRSEALLRLLKKEKLLYFQEGTFDDHALGLTGLFFAKELHGYPPHEGGIPGLKGDSTLDLEALQRAHEEAWRPVFQALGPRVARLGLEGFLRYYRLLYEDRAFQDRTFPNGLTVRHGKDGRLLDAAHPDKGSLGERFWHPKANPLSL